MAEDLVLDTAIRDWVLVPLSVVMVLIGVLRYFVAKLMRSFQPPDRKVLKEGQVVLRARNLKAGANFIPAKSFRARRFYFTNEENGLLHVPKDQAQNAQAQMFSDPNMAMDMMKKNLSMIIPQTLTFAWVNFFFSGFVAAKIPFPLTQRFRSMLQNGIDLSTVDVSYVSSRSWYFLNLFGLRGLFSLILGEENAQDDTQRMMQMGGFGFDPTKCLNILLAMELYHFEVVVAVVWYIADQLVGANALLVDLLHALVEGKMGDLVDAFPSTKLAGLVRLVTHDEEEVDVAARAAELHHSLSAEKDSVDIVQHEWVLPKMEQRAEETLRKLVK
ncbi:putative ER membrane protein complex subunit 3 [Cocos nucifera]|uniref:ER membrane protein complex subunit 3 n=1 Tax=Cocos nucifera TaxID=13894 RepID=A0A8K0NAF9_COCNU|nr:putative ER membrane protein complex subunit 3 [Cocos nucifera]